MAPRKQRPQWTSRDVDSAAKLELPLLLLLQPDKPQTIQPLQDSLGHGKVALERALSYLCSRGLAYRREEYHKSKFYPVPNSGEVRMTNPKLIRRWILSQRGADWRDQRISRGDLGELPERYQHLAHLECDRLEETTHG